MKKVYLTVLLSALFLLCFSSCSKKNSLPVLDLSDPLATKPGVEWGLIYSPYAGCHREADYESEVVEHLRKGTIRIINGTQTIKVDGNYEKWFLVEEGWVPENSVKIYSNKLKAQNAAKEFVK